MYPQIDTVTPTRPMDTYTVSTPYGIVTISDGGRRVTFQLYDDIHQSRHNTALFAYLEQLKKRGITRYNISHIMIDGRDRTLGLKRGNARLDLVYMDQGKLFECELKTNREVGLDLTAIQLTELAKHCERLVVLVPRGSMEEMSTILHLINLSHCIAIQPYDEYEEEDN